MTKVVSSQRILLRQHKVVLSHVNVLCLLKYVVHRSQEKRTSCVFTSLYLATLVHRLTSLHLAILLRILFLLSFCHRKLALNRGFYWQFLAYTHEHSIQFQTFVRLYRAFDSSLSTCLCLSKGTLGTLKLLVGRLRSVC